MTKVTITDWDGEEDVIIELHTPVTNPGVCYDGGRIDIDGVAETHWVISSRWKIDFTED